jgi:hypothetical protein
VGNIDLIEARASQRNDAHSKGMQLIQNRRVQLVVYKDANRMTATRQRYRCKVQRFAVEDPFDWGVLSLLF